MVKNDFQRRFKEPPLLHRLQRYGVCSIVHLTVPVKAFPRVVPLRYPVLKMVLSGTVAIREPPLKIYFQAPVNLISMVVAVLQPLFETVFPTMAMEMQPLLKTFFFVLGALGLNKSPLKIYLQVWFHSNCTVPEINFKLLKFPAIFEIAFCIRL